MKFKIRKQLIILVDFDLTICKTEYPGVGEIYPFVKECMLKWYNQGAYIIINTCRNGRTEKEAEAFLLQQGIPFHKMNGQHPNGLLEFGTDAMLTHGLDTKKAHGHLNIDDTNLEWAANGMPTWDLIDKLVQKYINNLGADNKYNITPDNDYSYVKETIIQVPAEDSSSAQGEYSNHLEEDDLTCNVTGLRCSISYSTKFFSSEPCDICRDCIRARCKK